MLGKILGVVKPPYGASISEATTVVDKKVGAALSRPGFRLQVEMLRSIAEVMGTIGARVVKSGWAAGAPRHSQPKQRPLAPRSSSLRGCAVWGPGSLRPSRPFGLSAQNFDSDLHGLT